MHAAVLALTAAFGFFVLIVLALEKPPIAHAVPLQLSLGLGIGTLAAIVILALRVDLIPDNLESGGVILLLGALVMGGAAMLWWWRRHQ